jgi:hypothetical protein
VGSPMISRSCDSSLIARVVAMAGSVRGRLQGFCALHAC